MGSMTDCISNTLAVLPHSFGLPMPTAQICVSLSAMHEKQRMEHADSDLTQLKLTMIHFALVVISRTTGV